MYQSEDTFEASSEAETVIDVYTDEVFIIVIIITLSVLCARSEAARKQWGVLE